LTLQQIENRIFQQPLADLVAKLNYFRRLERTWKLIEKDYADRDLGLEKAAKVSGVSKNHLNVLMRRATGFTFYQLLIRYRLLRAVIMMRSRN
jgi:AraC-like DNA-binding protein